MSVQEIMEKEVMVIDTEGSSCFSYIEYRSGEEILSVQFRSGNTVYDYRVDPLLLRDFLNSDSLGKFFYANIRNLSV